MFDRSFYFGRNCGTYRSVRKITFVHRKLSNVNLVANEHLWQRENSRIAMKVIGYSTDLTLREENRKFSWKMI